MLNEKFQLLPYRKIKISKQKPNVKCSQTTLLKEKAKCTDLGVLFISENLTLKKTKQSCCHKCMESDKLGKNNLPNYRCHTNMFLDTGALYGGILSRTNSPIH